MSRRRVRPVRAMRAPLVLVCVAVLLAGACRGGGDAGGGGSTPEAGDTTSTVLGADTSAPAGGEATTTSITTGGGGGTTVPTTAAGRSTSMTAAGSTPTTARPPSGTAAPAAAGTYRYRQSGRQTAGPSSSDAPGEGTLTVDSADGSGVQQWRRVVAPGKWSADSTIAFTGSGPMLRATTLRNSAGGVSMTSTCTFDPPMPAPPWPLQVGATFSGHADCGDFTVAVSGSVTGTRDVVIDGATRTTFVVSSRLTTHGHIESTGMQVDWSTRRRGCRCTWRRSSGGRTGWWRSSSG